MLRSVPPAVSQVHVHLGRAGNGEDGHRARGDALPAARSRRGRDLAVSLHRDQRDEDDGPSSGLRPDSAGGGSLHSILIYKYYPRSKGSTLT